jgi:hypothetical protein
MTTQEAKQLIDDAILMFPRGNRYVTDDDKTRYIREDIVMRVINLLTGTDANVGVDTSIKSSRTHRK